MADITPTPAPAPKTKQARSVINREHTTELANSCAVAAAALDPARAAALAEEDFDATLPGQIIALATKIETDLGKLTGQRATKTEMTAQEKAARDALMAVLAPIQIAAKRKYTGDQAELRAAYYIGKNLAGESLRTVLTATRAVRDRLVPGKNNAPPQDELPGVKADGKIKKLADTIARYDSKNTAQGDEQNKAESLLETVKADLATLAGLRHAVQLAADQAWPWRTPGVATIRKDFLLPTDRPLPD